MCWFISLVFAETVYLITINPSPEVSPMFGLGLTLAARKNPSNNSFKYNRGRAKDRGLAGMVRLLLRQHVFSKSSQIRTPFHGP